MKSTIRPLFPLLYGATVAWALQACAVPPGSNTGASPAPAMGAATTAPVAQATALQVTGAVERPLRVDLAALQALPPVQVTAHGRTYTGASLWALLGQAGIRGVAAKPAATGALYLVATGSDGFKAVLSLGEIDPSYGNRQAVVAYGVDGAGLGANGFARLIVAGDTKMSRAVSRLVAIEVMAPPAAR